MSTPALKNLLVGVDFSTSSEAALAGAVDLSSRLHGALAVVHVVEAESLRDLSAVSGTLETSLSELLVTEAQDCLQKLVAQNVARKNAGHPRLEVCIGIPIEEIRRLLQAVGADLLVLGWQGRSRSGVGSLAMRALHAAPTDVLLVDELHAPPAKRVAACVDFSVHSPAVVRRAAELARAFDAPLHLVHAFSAPWFRLDVRPTAQRHQGSDLEKAHEGRQAELRALARSADTQGLEVTCQVVHHTCVGFGLVDYLRQENVDLAVLGARGRTNLRYVTLGSEVERVIAQLPCSLYLVKPERGSARNENA